MTPQVAERLLYESEAALRLVDSLLSELEEGDPDRSHEELDPHGDECANLSTRMVVLARPRRVAARRTRSRSSVRISPRGAPGWSASVNSRPVLTQA